MKDNEILVFSHIPKTAGTSLKYLFRRYFGTEQLDAAYRANSKDRACYYPRDFKLDQSVVGKTKLLAGHCIKPYIDFEEYEEQFRWFTFLRNPIDRYISHYIHQQTKGSTVYHMDLLSWGSKFNRSDWMTKMIAGENDLEKAKDILKNKIELIGFTEHFNDSMKMIKTHFELNKFDIELSGNRMVSKGSGIKQKILSEYEKYETDLKEQNKNDILLYEFALKEIWPKQQKLLQSYQPYKSNDSQNKSRINKLFYKRNLIYKPFVKIDNAIIKLKHL